MAVRCIVANIHAPDPSEATAFYVCDPFGNLIDALQCDGSPLEG